MSATSDALRDVITLIAGIQEDSHIQPYSNNLHNNSKIVNLNGHSYAICLGDSPDNNLEFLLKFFSELSALITTTKNKDTIPLSAAVFCLTGLEKLKPKWPTGTPVNAFREDTFGRCLYEIRTFSVKLKKHLGSVAQGPKTKEIRQLLKTPELEDYPQARFQLADIWIEVQTHTLPPQPRGLMWIAQKGATTTYLVGSVHLLPSHSPVFCHSQLPSTVRKIWNQITAIGLEIARDDPDLIDLPIEQLPPQMESKTILYHHGTESVLYKHINSTRKSSFPVFSLEKADQHMKTFNMLGKLNLNVPSEDMIIKLWPIAKHYFNGDHAGMEKLCKKVINTFEEKFRIEIWDKRNEEMAAKIDRLNLNNLLACVGVSHYYGINSICDFLRQKGWTVEEFNLDSLTTY